MASSTGRPLTAMQIPCCLCGTMILPNAANQCSTCLAQEFNLQERLQRAPAGAEHITIYQCRKCRRYKRTDKHYEQIEPESPELLALCLKQIPALQHHHGVSSSTSSTGGSAPLHLVDAAWVWTEPHSMRFKLRLTIRTEIQSVAVQQRVMVELRCAWQMCDSCDREYTNRTWHAVVQLRQKRSDDGPRNGLAALEMALAKNEQVRKHVLRIDSTKNGLDFYFLSLARAQTFVHFLQSAAPMRVRTTQKFVSVDVKSNTANLKHTLTCDVVPLCRDDLVLIHKSAKAKLAGRLAIVTKLAAGVIHLVDASPKRENLADSQMEVAADFYYMNEKYFTVLLSSHRLARFVALDVDLCDTKDSSSSSNPIYQGPANGVEKYALADVHVARESSGFDELLHTVSHLGHLLNAGDTVLGYDLGTTIGGDWELETSLSSNFEFPDVVLVKKVVSDRGETTIHESSSSTDDKPKLSKKKERRRQKENKRMRELEESAVRMGFIQADEGEDNFDAAVSAMERDLEALGVQEDSVTRTDDSPAYLLPLTPPLP